MCLISQHSRLPVVGTTGTLPFALVFGILFAIGVTARESVAQDSTGTEWLNLAQNELVDIIARSEKSVVAIALVRQQPAAGPLVDPFGIDGSNSPDAPDYVPFEFGSGVVIGHPDDVNARYVLTNYHVVHGSRRPADPVTPARLMIRLHSRHAVWGTEVAGDPRSDLSILALDLETEGVDPNDVPPFEIRDVPPPRKGQLVVSLGNPYAIARDGSASASIGIIGNISRRAMPIDAVDGEQSDAALHELGTLLTLDTRLQFGSSGGAVVDLDGNLIGMTTSLAALEGYEASAGYAIPLDAGFRRVVDSLLAGHEVEYGFLGVALRDVLQDETRQWEQVAQPTAASADHVAIDSPAHQGGLRAGDVILAVNGVAVYGASDVTREVGLLGPEAIATLSVFRPSDSQAVSIEVRLGKSPVQNESAIVATSRRWPLWRGLGIDYSTSRSRFMPFDVVLTYRKAVLVQEVTAGSPAEQAGLKVGDMIAAVNEASVETPGEFHQAVEGASGVVELVLLDGRTVLITAPVAPAN